jgi:hypothetical protein
MPGYPAQITSPASNYWLEVAQGNIPGVKLVHKFGRNIDADTGTIPEDVWVTGGQIPWITSDSRLQIVSTDNNDNQNSIVRTGMHQIYVEGLDINFDEVSETANMNGPSGVNLTQRFSRINRAYGVQTGTYHGANVGTITTTFLDASGAPADFTIPIGVGQTQKAAYSLARQKKAYLLSAHVGVEASASKTATVSLFQATGIDDQSVRYDGCHRIFQVFDNVSDHDSWYPATPVGPFIGPCDIWAEVTDVSANDTIVDVNFELVVIDD